LKAQCYTQQEAGAIGLVGNDVYCEAEKAFAPDQIAFLDRFTHGRTDTLARGAKHKEVGRTVFCPSFCSQFRRRRTGHGEQAACSALPYSDPLDFIQDAGFSKADVSPSFSPRYAARTIRRITFAFRVFGMSPTNKTSLGASALPSWAANAFSKL
jgi:hypothetical protein